MQRLERKHPVCKGASPGHAYVLVVCFGGLPGIEGDGEGDFGDLSVRVDPSQAYEDEPGKEPASSTLGPWVSKWSRPGVIFSPFRPMVVRPTTDGDPYAGVPPPGVGG
jgi:hypothetical protein